MTKAVGIYRFAALTAVTATALWLGGCAGTASSNEGSKPTPTATGSAATTTAAPTTAPARTTACRLVTDDEAKAALEVTTDWSHVDEAKGFCTYELSKEINSYERGEKHLSINIFTGGRSFYDSQHETYSTGPTDKASDLTGLGDMAFLDNETTGDSAHIFILKGSTVLHLWATGPKAMNPANVVKALGPTALSRL